MGGKLCPCFLAGSTSSREENRFASFDHLLYRKTFVRKQGAAALPNAPVIAGSGFSLPHVQ
jgi:hypothetical protein